MTSRNATVASALGKKAGNACARNADNGDVLVEFTVPDAKGLTKVQQRMTPTEFETWLKKTGNGSKAQDIWFALMKGNQASFMHTATRVSVTAL